MSRSPAIIEPGGMKKLCGDHLDAVDEPTREVARGTARGSQAPLRPRSFARPVRGSPRCRAPQTLSRRHDEHQHTAMPLRVREGITSHSFSTTSNAVRRSGGPPSSPRACRRRCAIVAGPRRPRGPPGCAPRHPRLDDARRARRGRLHRPSHRGQQLSGPAIHAHSADRAVSNGRLLTTAGPCDACRSAKSTRCSGHAPPSPPR